MILKCRRCNKFVSHRFLGPIILAPDPMMAEDHKVRPGKWECLTCGNRIEIGENGVVKEILEKE